MAKRNTKYLEGDEHDWDIGTREGKTDIELFRNSQTALKNGGFTGDFADFPGQLVDHQGSSRLMFIDNRGSFDYQTVIITAGWS